MVRISIVVNVSRNDGPSEQWAEFVDNDPKQLLGRPSWLDDGGEDVYLQSVKLANALHVLKRAVSEDPLFSREFGFLENGR